MSDSGGLFRMLRRLEIRRTARSAAAVAFLGGAVVSVAATWAFVLARASLPPALLALAFALPGFVALAGFWLKSRTHPDLPAVLLRLDLHLGLDARLSSLFELESRPGEPNPHAARLLREIQSRTPRWTQAFRPSRRVIACFVAGAGLFVALAVAAPLALSVRSTAPEASPETASGLVAGDGIAPLADTAEPATQPSVTPEPDSDATERPKSTPEGTTQSAGVELVDLLAELRGRAGREAVVDAEEETGPPPDGASTRADALESLVQRLSAASGPMSEDELQSLREAIASRDDALAAAVDKLLANDEPSTLREDVLSLLDKPEAPQSEVARADSPRVDEVKPEESATQDDGAQVDAPSAAAAANAGTEVGDAGSSSDGTLGGESGTGEASPPEPSPFDSRFVAVAPPSAVGSTGPVIEYLTRGVPIEGDGSESSTPGVPAIDFARVDSIMSARSVPAEALQTIRSYFERITRGGP